MLKRPDIFKVILLTCFMILPWLGISQPGDPETDPDVPISGIEILIGLGGLYGAKKYVDLKRKNR
jgi:hypothetical protein